MSQDTVKVRLDQIAVARSGDKGDHVNIGIIARRREWFSLLDEVVTPSLLDRLFGEMAEGGIERYSMEGIGALNVLLLNALQGGGTVALRLDAQGKSIGQALLRTMVDVPHNLAEKLNLEFT
ncbi:MAG TPA: hypothetical protein QF646_02810 [Candidatus Poseidoniales archaeon]|nr:hypothetical protein [Candidatus Poseidoniales archaeon]